MKSEHYKRVEEFMKLAGQDTPDSPTIPSLEVRELRANLILEEALETIHGLGFSLNCDIFDSRKKEDYYHFEFVDKKDPNLKEIIDGCADVSVVTYGTLVACGVPDMPFIEEVDNNNLAKFGPGHSYREDGKLIKPPGHQPPKIEEILSKLR